MAECGHSKRGYDLTRKEWRPRPDGLEESVQFTPGYNCPVTGPHSHGVHGMEILWHLRGPAGAAQFRMGTNWIPGKLYPGHGLSPDGTNGTWDLYPSGWDVGYHARQPQYEGQEPIHDDCPIIGGICYYDGSGMRADALVKRFIEDGENVIWAELEDVYADLVREQNDALEASRGV